MTAEEDSPSSRPRGRTSSGPQKEPELPRGLCCVAPPAGWWEAVCLGGSQSAPGLRCASVHPSPFMSSNIRSSYPGGLWAASNSFLGPVYFRHFAPVSLLPLPSFGTPPQGSRCPVPAGSALAEARTEGSGLRLSPLAPQRWPPRRQGQQGWGSRGQWRESSPWYPHNTVCPDVRARLTRNSRDPGGVESELGCLGTAPCLGGRSLPHLAPHPHLLFCSSSARGGSLISRSPPEPS